MIVAHALTEATIDDATTAIDLIRAVDGGLTSVTGDAAYDTVAIYDVAGARGATVVIPPPYDHCTSQFLKQAGVPHEFVRLTDLGIRGNGQMMTLEKNNLEIAAFLDRWARQKIQ